MAKIIGEPQVPAPIDSQHTKGPWRFRLYATDDDPKELAKLGIKPVRLLDNSGGMAVSWEAGRIAVVDCQASYKRGHGHATECAERDANARLIAAAPDLLSALKGLMEALTMGPLDIAAKFGPDFNPDDVVIEAAKIASAAIAKAEGLDAERGTGAQRSGSTS